jgi:hypothetical protein
MSTKGNFKDDKEDNKSALQPYLEITDYARREIVGVRTVYMFLAPILGVIIAVGIWFTYKSAKDFKDEMRGDIQLLKKEVETRVDIELGKDAIQDLIKKRVTIRVDEVAKDNIDIQISAKVSPKIIEAEEKLQKLDKEMAKVKLRNHITELGDKSISNASRDAFEELDQIYNEAEYNSPEFYAADAEMIRVVLMWSSLRRTTDIPGTDHYDDSGINYEMLTTKELINHLSDQRWQVRRECAMSLRNKKEVDVVKALVKILKNEQDLEILVIALNSFRNITGMPNPGLLEYNKALEWWQKNENEVTKKLNANKTKN